MSPAVKAMLVAVPYILAVMIGFMNLMPSIEALNAKVAEVEQKRESKENLEMQLSTERTINEKSRRLQEEIQRIRAHIPKEPDLELFTIDLERMCEESGVDLVSIGPPKQEPGGGVKPETPISKAKKSGEKLKASLKGDQVTVASSTGTGKKKEKEEEAPKRDLEEARWVLKFTGNFHNLRRLLHKLESYERPLKVNSLVERIPKKEKEGKEETKLPEEGEMTETDELGDPRQLMVTLDVTAYYLP